MEKLKVKFRRIDNVVIVKVVQQDESTRGKLIFEYGGFFLKSKRSPAASISGTLYLRGCENKFDEAVNYTYFTSKKIAKEYIKKAKACIKAYNESLEEKEEVVKKEEGRWIPSKGDRYYFSNIGAVIGLEVGSVVWKCCDTDNYRLMKNKCSKTAEECLRAIEIEKKKMELSKVFSKEEWLDVSIDKYIILFDLKNKRFKTTTMSKNNLSATETFETRGKAEDFIDFCGADDYEKYVLGVY